MSDRGPRARTSRTPVEALDPLVQLLVRARQEAGLTQRELARKAGVSHAMITHMETGFRVGSLTTLKAVAGVYGWRVGLVNMFGREARL